MKKYIFIIIVLLIALICSIRINYIYAQKDKLRTSVTISNLFYSMKWVVHYLDNFLSEYDNNRPHSITELEFAANEYIRLQTMIRENSYGVDRPAYSLANNSLNNFIFSYMSGTLTIGAGGSQVSFSGNFSEKDLSYIKTFHDSLQSIVENMADKKDGNNVNRDLTVNYQYINELFQNFFDAWRNYMADEVNQ